MTGETCAWIERDLGDFYYETECGHDFIISGGTLSQNDFKYCVYCGRRIQEKNNSELLDKKRSIPSCNN